MNASAPSARIIWALALPAMLTNVATALFGMADMWVIGRLGDAGAQGAVELGARFMTSALVVFNFLRTGTTALTAQDAGRGQVGAEVLVRAMIVALGLAGLMLAAKGLAVGLGLRWLGADGAMGDGARAYVERRYWAVPAALANGVMVGWLVGRRHVRGVMGAEIAANIVHILLDLWLVLGLHWGVSGVASASLMSEWIKLAILVALCWRVGVAWRGVVVMRAGAFARLFALNRDLFLRTLLLTGAFLEFTRYGARAGAVTLAANGILFQMFMLSALILDGFETAAQVLCGEARGQGDATMFRAHVRANLRWGWLVGVGVALAYGLGGAALSASFSTDPAVRAAAAAYLPWAVVLPVLGVSSFVMDGVFVGAGWARAMLGTMALAFAAFNATLWLAAPWGNHGLWLAFSVLFVVRAGGQGVVMPGLITRQIRPPAHAALANRA